MRRILAWVAVGVFGFFLAATVPHRVLAQQAQEAPAEAPAKFESGRLGVELRDLPEPSVKALGLSQAHAVLVVSPIQGGPGERAGLLPGDVIVELEGAPVGRLDAFIPALQRLGAGNVATLGVLRGNERLTVRATLERAAGIGSELGRLGVELSDLSEPTIKALGLNQAHALLVQLPHPGGPAERAGLRQGDVIVELEGAPVGHRDAFIPALQRLGAGSVATLVLLRGNQRLTIRATLARAADMPPAPDSTDPEHVIEVLEALVRIVGPEIFRVEWSSLQYTLGTTYDRRIRGDRVDNSERAIAAFEAALTGLTREALPREWSDVQNNLGLAYGNRIRGDRADNLEKAIGAYQAALTVMKREESPHYWAHTQRMLGDAYARRIQGDLPDNLEKAIAAYQATLTVRTREADPREHVGIAIKLGVALLRAKEWRRAGLVYASARETYLQLFGQGLNDEEARNLIDGTRSLFAHAAFAAAATGELEKALALSNEGLARQLRVALRRQALELPAEKRPRYEALTAELRGWERIVETTRGVDAIASLEKVVALRQQLGDLIAPHLPKESGLTRELIPEGGAIAVPIVSAFGGKLLIVTSSSGEPSIGVIDLPQLTSGRLDRLMRGDGGGGGWLGAYRGQHQEAQWLAAIEGLGRDLWELLGAALDRGLKERGVKPGARVAILPTAGLGLLPLGLAQDRALGRRLAETWEIVQAPSFEALATAHAQAGKAAVPSLAAAINPTGDLRFTEVEGALVAARFAGKPQLKLDTAVATADLVMAALKGKSYWHFASHGAFDWNDARQSGLVMREGERLTIGRVLEAQGSLGRPRLVVLSACETGLYDIDRNPDEFVGLPAAFMQAGATGVVGSLWLVDDLATGIMMAKFYDLHLGRGLAPPTALRQAQSWLRDSTRTELMAYAKAAAAKAKVDRTKLAELNGALTRGRRSASSRFAGLWSALQEKAEPARGGKAKQRRAPAMKSRPFRHPYFWAGFVYTGL